MTNAEPIKRLVCVLLLLTAACTAHFEKAEAPRQSHVRGEKDYKEALVTAELSGSDWKIVHSLHDLAEFYRSSRRYNEAEPFYLRAKSIAESKGLRDQLAKSLNGLGTVYSETSRYSEAETSYKRAIEIDESIARALESENPQLATDLGNLAELYRVQGRFAEAEPLYERSRGIYQRTARYESVGISLNNQAMLYANQNRNEDAEQLFQASIAQFKAAPARPEYVANPFMGLARIYSIQHKYPEAEHHLKKAITILEKVPSNDAMGSLAPEMLVSCLEGLSVVQSAQGRQGEAEISYQRALTIAEQTLGSQHPRVMEMRKSLRGKQL